MSQKDNEITKKIQAGYDPEDLDEELEEEDHEETIEFKQKRLRKLNEEGNPEQRKT